MKQKILVLFFFCCIGLISCPINNNEDYILRENIYIYNYIPFWNKNKLAVLPQEASINFLENLPRLDGSTSLYPVYASFVQATYPSTKNYYDTEYGIVKCTTTPNAYINLINGDVDIIFCFEPSQEQIAMAAEKGKTFNLTQMGKDAFVFFVNINNPVNNLTGGQIQGIYSGNIKNWLEVGGGNASIMAYQRPPNSGSQTALVSIMNGIPLMKPPSVSESMTGIIEDVAAYRNRNNSIGYSFLFFTTEMVNNNRIKLLSIDSVMPTIATIQSDEYPFTEVFYAITTGNESENTITFINWILSDEGQYLVEKTGYVPINCYILNSDPR